MNNKPLQHVLNYAAAVAAIGVATWFRDLLEPLVADRVPFVTYFAAVVFIAWYSGMGPALLATCLGSLAALYFFISPHHSLLPNASSAWVAWALFLFVGGATALLSQSRRWALDKVAHQQLSLREEELRFNVTLTHIGDGVIMIDTEGQVTFMNSVAEKLTGFELKQARGQAVEQVYRSVHDRSRSEAENPARKAIELEGAVALPNFPILISHAGKELPIDDHAVPLFADDGTLQGAVLLFRDDTHRRKARKALRASEMRFRTLADSAPVLIWMADTDGKCNFFNQPWLDFTGNTLQQERDEGWAQGIHADDRARRLQLYSEAFAERQDFHMEYRLRKADGAYRWLIDHGIPLFDSEGEFTGYIGSCVDITRQREAADALRESEGRFRALADNAPAAIFIKDLQGHYVLANPLACRSLGRDDVVGHTDLELLPRDLADLLIERDQQVIATGQVVESEDMVDDGKLRRMFLSVKFPLHDAREQIVGVCGVAFDITDRKRSEEALRESEETFHSMSDSIPQLAWMARPDGHIFWYNQRWYDYTGSNFEQMEGWGWEAVHDPQHLPHVLQSFQEAFSRGVPWEDTFPLRRHDGVMRWHLSRAQPVRNQAGEIIRWFGTNTDITDRKRTESTLRFLANASESLASLTEARQEIEKVAELAVGAFADWCEVVFAEGNQCEHVVTSHVDRERSALVTKLTQCTPPQATDRFGVGEVLRQLQSQFMPTVTPQLRAQLARDDEHRQLLDQLELCSLLQIPITVHDQLLGVISFCRSDPEHCFTEEDRAMAEDLAHRMGISIENARLYQELREADRRKDDFLAMLAHELRNPLAPIRTGLDLLSLQAAADSHLVRSMQRQVEHLVRLVDDLLDVSRIMRGKVELRQKKVKLQELLEQAIHATNPLIGQQCHELTVSTAEEEVWLYADPVRIVQIVENLITNACKYTDSGGKIELLVSHDDSQVTIIVRDNGIGIEPELLPRVFDLFTQSTRSLDRSQGGLGIGLTLVSTLVEMHGGSISAQSEGHQQGSEFVVCLPTCLPGSVEVEQPTAASGARRVLLVDDNRAAVDILRLLLLQLGPHTVEVLYSGEIIEEKIESFDPEIILLDIGLPGKNGYEIARQIRSNPARSELLLAALTGYGQEEDRQKSQQAGFDVHLVKPPAMDEIASLFSHPKLSVNPKSYREDAMEPAPESLPKNTFASHDSPEEAPAEEQLESLRTIIHDLGNTAHVVTMAAKILEQSDDPADQQTVGRMLEATREEMIKSLQALKEHAGGQPAGSR